MIRVGSTVRRVAGPWTPNVAALLTGLHAAGVRFRWAALHLEDLIAYSYARAAQGDAALQRTIDEGHVLLYEGDLRYIRSLLSEA
ncbi:MAG: hypothetical protein KY440_05315 [Actinobacteria bacterium]|nr:hypothetical protein [Actinomycetota bacterium]